MLRTLGASVLAIVWLAGFPGALVLLGLIVSDPASREASRRRVVATWACIGVVGASALAYGSMTALKLATAPR